MFETFKQYPFTCQNPNKARCRLEKVCCFCQWLIINPTQNQSVFVKSLILSVKPKLQFDHKASWWDQSLGEQAPINWHRVSEAWLPTQQSFTDQTALFLMRGGGGISYTFLLDPNHNLYVLMLLTDYLVSKGNGSNLSNLSRVGWIHHMQQLHLSFKPLSTFSLQQERHQCRSICFWQCFPWKMTKEENIPGFVSLDIVSPPEGKEHKQVKPSLPHSWY